MPARTFRGAISFNISSILPKTESSMNVNPVMLPPGRARLSTNPNPTGSDTPGITMGIVRDICIRIGMTRPSYRNDHIGLRAHQSCCVGSNAIHVVGSPMLVEFDITALDPSRFSQCITQSLDMSSVLGVVLGIGHQNAHSAHRLGLLRARRQRPYRRRAADERDELTPLHSTTRSARAMTVGGTVMPSPLATVRLMLSSNVVGCCIGRSEGFAPLRILST